MDHADVQAWLDEAFFAPATARDDEPTSAAVDEHLAQCPDCAAHATALRRTSLMLDLARGPAPATRARIIEAARQVGRPRRTERAAQPWWRGALGLRLASASLVIALVGVGLGVAWAGATLPASPDQDTQRLTAAVRVMAELAGQPSTHEMVLHDQSGREAGMAIMSTQTHQVAIFTTALVKPAGDEYDFYLERASGERVPMGPMQRADGVTFWAGQMADDIEGLPGDRLVVAADEQSPAMLSASL